MSSTKASKATRPIDQLIFDVFAPASESTSSTRTPKPVRPTRNDRRRQGSAKVGLLVLAAAMLGAIALAGPALFGGSNASTTTPSTTVVSTEDAAATAAAPAVEAPQAQASQPSTQPSTPVAPAASVKVVQQGFTQLAPELDGDRNVVYAALLQNPRRDQVALDVQALVTFTGRGGAALKIEDEQLDSILPGQTGAIANDTELAGVTGIRVQVTVGRWADAKGFGGGLTASSVRTSRVAGKLTTTATLRSTLAQNVADADAVAVYFNKAGRVIGGQSEGIDFIPARGSVPVMMDTSQALRGIAQTKVYANTELFAIDD
jgi:hypothetical protein